MIQKLPRPAQRLLGIGQIGGMNDDLDLLRAGQTETLLFAPAEPTRDMAKMNTGPTACTGTSGRKDLVDRQLQGRGRSESSARSTAGS